MNMLEQLIPVLDAAIWDAFKSCKSVDEAGALWATLDASVSMAATSAIRAHGGNADEVRAALDRYFLENAGF